MRVRLKSLYAGPSGIIQPGALVDLPDTEASGLIAGGFASSEEKVKEVNTIEAAVAVVAPESAEIRRPVDNKRPMRPSQSKR